MSVEELIQKNIETVDFDKKSSVAATLGNVVIVCELLESSGKKITQSSVREALRGGSFTTIGLHLKNIKSKKSEEHELAEVEVPESVEDRAKQLLGDVWQSAIDEAEGRLSLQREELRVAQDEAQQEVDEARIAIETLEAEAKSYIELVSEKDGEIDGKSKEISALTSDLSGLVSENKIIKEKLSNETLNLEKSEEGAKKSRADFDSERNKNDTLTAEKINSIKETESLKKELNSNEINYKNDIESVKKELKLNNEKLEKLSLSNSSLKSNNASLEKNNRSLDLQQQKAQSALDLLVKTNADLKDEAKEMRKSLTDWSFENGELKGKNNALTNQNEKLAKDIALLIKDTQGTKK
ncbi:DNA-binding protein [Bathymodiolus japonicus methanotrophic gill symbiont]|uniref:DNA-binding protein n=1 Tax=Bathymodiolus japonicus methanotrophic gill symbiont TaxID=113269 RepID=UPI001C8DB632|nr:DNA-binding protein [Bathymodiolus japonicus methanotrophic gill symbiont]